jgi:hypothetical protein
MAFPNIRHMTRTVLIAAWAILSGYGCLNAAEFFVAPDGDDANPGTRAKPFASLMEAEKRMKPGDTAWLRGGTYRIGESDIARRDRLVATVFPLTRDGAKDKPLKFFAAPGERPVFDCSGLKPPGLRISVFRVFGSWIHLKGIEVIGVQVTMREHTQSICFENFGDHNVYERLTMRDGQAIGLYINRGANNLVLNCDAYRNHDHTSENGRGGNTDGFGCHVPRRGANNVFRGCRAWLNSDDGFDCISQGDAVVFENCWAFLNGYDREMQPRGDGHGFKVGGYGVSNDRAFPDPVPRNRVVRCVAARNRSSGFYANHHPGGIDWIHNSAWKNAVNFNFLGRSPDATRDVPGFGHLILNNLSHGSRNDVRHLDEAACQMSGNTFQTKTKPADEHFLSLDDKLLASPRKPDGSLPDIPFLRLAPGNPWIDTGARSADSYRGEAPDPGAFEAK